MPLPPVTLTFDILTLTESRVTSATSVPILIFLGLSLLDLGRTVRDRQTDRHQSASSLKGQGHNNPSPIQPYLNSKYISISSKSSPVPTQCGLIIIPWCGSGRDTATQRE